MSNAMIEANVALFRLHRAGVEVQIRPFQPGDQAAFRALNEQWISKYFGIENKDREVLSDPVGKILLRGGHIFLAVDGSLRIGTCALLAIEPGVFEVAKMAVEERYRGSGVGRALLEYTIVEAIKHGARRLYLETNNRLTHAIHLYESMGFKHLDLARVKPSPYARANVFMERLL